MALRRVRQADYRRIFFEFSGPGKRETICVTLSPPYVRLHRFDEPLPKALPRPPRFAAVLKARLEGARLVHQEQLGQERIVRWEFHKGGEILFLDAKLWANAANLILSSKSGCIIDAFSRRPNRQEIPGACWPPQELFVEKKREDLRDGAATIQKKQWEIRSLPGKGDWNSRVAQYFQKLEENDDAKSRRREWTTHIQKHLKALELRQAKLEASASTDQSQEGYWAGLILANQHKIHRGDQEVEVTDWQNPDAILCIPLNPALNAVANAEHYFDKQRRREGALARLQEEREVLEAEHRHWSHLAQRLVEGSLEAPFDAPPHQQEKRASKVGEKPLPGLWITKPPYLFIVGRNAKESDEILRRWARGNDLWFHVRDYAGSHVFLRGMRGKSIPLEIMLDAGTLAMRHSKAKNLSSADLYCTAVKNLRRVKGGKAGSVIPTHEKNLRITMDEKRLKRLLHNSNQN